MRSHLLLRRTRLSLKPPSIVQRALLSSTRAPNYPRKDSARPATTVRLAKRSSSSATAPSTGENPDEPDENPNETKDVSKRLEEPAEDAEKPATKRRTRASSVKDPEAAPSSIPAGLNILWLPDESLPPQADSAEPNTSSSALPPPEIFQEVLTNLHIALHPQTQHKASWSTTPTGFIEPTLALYCPIEGGDYVIDETVRELGRRTGAEVVVLDAVHLAAAECGHFGQAASVLHLPNNPLHFTSPPSFPQAGSSSQALEEDEDEYDDEGPSTSGRVTLQVLTPSMIPRPGRAVVTTSRKATPSASKLKAFFEELINVPSPTAEAGGLETPPRRPPRIVYLRDFTTLAASSSTWYPALVSAVRARRHGPIPRPTSPVYNPTTIVFGITPSIVSPTAGSTSSPSTASGLVNFLISRQSVSSGTLGVRPGKAEYGESELAEKARERRLRERLRRWERGDPTLHDDLPRLSSPSENEDRDGSPHVVVMGGSGPSELPVGISSMLAQAMGSRTASRSSSSEDERPVRFFRTSVIVPNVRSHILEKSCRVARRREINELTMRMGVSSVGGSLPKLDVTPDDAQYVDEGPEPDPAARRMWDEWGRVVEVWTNVRRIADRAVGKAIASKADDLIAFSQENGLDSVPVDWEFVYEAWAVQKASKDMRKAWVQHSSGKPKVEKGEAEEQSAPRKTDEVIERVKRDPDLDQHEQRLLGCIVDIASISTTFNHVHLPERTIDSIRTIVSLPLLHPTAFQHGILKEHAMTGCLLFGPPGTGKTLVVRALAKEAGCRMMIVSPSDVMDMYVGEGEKLVRSVFSLARRLSPCVVFIDEIDALFGARVAARESGGAIAHRGVITEFMQEMDGLKSSKDDNVIVIGATNRPFDLDDAILRRLPRRLLVDLPGEKERAEILKILLRDEPLASDVDLTVLARKTESFSGSDLKHLCVSAALDAVKEHVDVPWRPAKHHITKQDSTDSTSKDATRPASELTSEVQQDILEARSQPLETSLDTELDSLTLNEVPDAIVSPDEAPSAENVDTEIFAANSAESQAPPSQPIRALHWRNFTAALREITPSSSEALGTLADLRKWNEEFGEGRKEKRKQVWGKGRFGFTPRPLNAAEEGKVQNDSLASSSVTSTGKAREGSGATVYEPNAP